MRALIAAATDDGLSVSVGSRQLSDDEVVIDVAMSALNFKDALVADPRSRVRRTDDLVLGVEAAGVVRSSRVAQFAPGDPVIAFGGSIGVGRDGGFAEQLAVPGRYVTALPAGLDARQAMIHGLAGYTAMASVLALEERPLDGPVLVTGASGGVGSLAVHYLQQHGHGVTASSGSPEHRDWLLALGAGEVIGRDDIDDRPDRVLGTERWAGAIDCVGGAALTAILRSLRYGATVAASGLVAGAELAGTVYPFITRAIRLVGIDAVEAPTSERDQVWARIAQIAGDEDRLVERTISLSEVPEALEVIRRGLTRGRWLVDPSL